jgi:hypothetical protein
MGHFRFRHDSTSLNVATAVGYVPSQALMHALLPQPSTQLSRSPHPVGDAVQVENCVQQSALAQTSHCDADGPAAQPAVPPPASSNDPSLFPPAMAPLP